MLNISHNIYNNECSILVKVLPVAMNDYYRTRLVTMQYLSGRDTTLHHDVRESWRARIVLAIAESNAAPVSWVTELPWCSTWTVLT